jgi:hypothetical protein
MNFYGLKKEFDRMCRTAGLDEMGSLRDTWINQAWEKITEIFVIPSLTKTILFDSVAGQQNYLLPYDYNGTEIGLMYNNRRLDPVPDENLRLKYERRSGNMGQVRFYDWSGVAGDDLFTVSECTLANGSSTVLCDSTDARLNTALWVRFDPYADASNPDREDDIDNMVDPKDYGYLISAGNFASGTSFRLTQAYRGPNGDQFTARVRPAEQQQFITYGIPSASETNIFNLRYSSRPRRLWNDRDVPEWPNMGIPIAYMAISIGLEWHHNMELSTTFWGRAVQRVKGLERRRKRVEALVSDVTVGSSVSRQTGMRGVWLTNKRYR